MGLLNTLKKSIRINRVATLLKRRRQYQEYIIKVKQYDKQIRKELRSLLKQMEYQEIYEAWHKAGYMIDEECEKIIHKNEK